MRSDVRDRDGLTAWDLLVADRPEHISFSLHAATEVFTWGDNPNVTLGHASEQKCPVPDSVDFFRRLRLSVVQVVRHLLEHIQI